MKKLSIYSALAAVVALPMVSSCGDNENFCVDHVLTAEELAEMRRQDSIAEVQRNTINADLVLNYSCEFYVSETSYDGCTLPIPMDQVAQLFGLSNEEVLNGIAGEAVYEGASVPEIKGLCIQGTTHADLTTKSNTNSYWGHWWDANGDVTTWGEDAVVFAEFDAEASAFNVGQYPTHCVAGTTYTFMEGLRYEDKRVVFVISATATERGEVTAGVVGEQDLTLTTKTTFGYEAEVVPGFDINKLYADLGVSSLNDVKWLAVKTDGSYAQEYSADFDGYWYDMQGFAGSWGDDASVYCGHDGENIVVGQFPSRLEAGTNLTIQYGAIANDKIEMLTIHVIIEAGDDINSATVAGTSDFAIATQTTYGYEQELVTDDFSKIFADLGVASLDEITWVGVNADGTYTQGYTADANAFWYDLNGYVGSWGDSASVYLGLYDGAIRFGQYPDRLHAGDEVTVHYGAYANGKIELINVKISISDYTDPEVAPEGEPENASQDITLTWTCNKEWAGSEEVDVRDVLRNAFKMTTYQIFQAFQNGELVMYNGDATEGDPGYTGEAPGYWLNAEGKTVSWGEEAIYYCFLGLGKDFANVYAANHPDNCTGALESQVTYRVVCRGMTVTLNIKIQIGAPA